MRQSFYLIVLLSGLWAGSLNAQVYEPNWNSLDQRPIPEWWQDAKFGIFIHWGVYSVPAYTTLGNYAEWYQNSLTNNAHDGKIKAYHETNFGQRSYYDLAPDFHAELFNPDEWASLFEKSGAKYVVLTSKHHDGFCLWPSQTANKTWGFPWNAMDVGPRRDLLGELFTALRKTSVHPGLYYSLYEWYNPLWKFDHARYATDHALPQLVDLVNNYQPDVIWADGDWDATPETWQSQQFLAWLYNQSPVRNSVVTNDRWGSGVRFNHAGVYTPEYQPDIDFEDHPWEESRGMGYSYGYNRLENVWDYNSTQALLIHLVDKVAHGGNFLLDIGPDAHGQIPPIMQERLLEMGKWLDTNGEAIYSTRRWRTPVQWSAGNREISTKKASTEDHPVDLLLQQTLYPDSGYAVKEVFFTFNPTAKNLYAIFPKWPGDRRLVLKNLSIPPGANVNLLGFNQKLRADNVSGVVYVYLPEFNPNLFSSEGPFVVKIAGYGEYVNKPEIQLNYAPQNMQPIVSMQCSTPGAVIRYAIDDEILNEKSKEYKQPLLLNKDAKVRAKAFKSGILESNESEATVKMVPFMPGLSMFRQPDAGLRKLLLNYNGTATAEIESGSLQGSADVGNFELDPQCLNGTCSVVWKGYVNIEKTGGYQFWTNSDDGSLLYLDGQLIVDNGGNHGMRERNGYANLQQGWHTIKVLYFNSGGAAGLQVQYAPLIGNQRQDIPASAFGH